jgi:dCMP deaminase
MSEEDLRVWTKKWDERFMRIALEIADWSKDTSTKVGCVVVRERRILSTGYNGFPRGCNDDVEDRMQRPLKYMWTVHAETNAIYNASRVGVSLERATAYVTMFPCCDCAKAVVQAGIHRLVAPAPNFECDRWGHSHRVASEMLLEGGCLVEPFEMVLT